MSHPTTTTTMLMNWLGMGRTSSNTVTAVAACATTSSDCLETLLMTSAVVPEDLEVNNNGNSNDDDMIAGAEEATSVAASDSSSVYGGQGQNTIIESLKTTTTQQTPTTAKVTTSVKAQEIIVEAASDEDDDLPFPTFWELLLTLYIPILVQSFFGTLYIVRSVLLGYGLQYAWHLGAVLVSKIASSAQLQQLLQKSEKAQGVAAVVSTISADPNAWPLPPALIVLGTLTIAALIVHPDGITWILLRKIRDGFMSVFTSSHTCWAIVVNDYGTIISTLLALSTFVCLFFFTYVLHQTLFRRKAYGNNKRQPATSEKHKRKKRKNGNHNSRNKNRIRTFSNGSHGSSSSHPNTQGVEIERIAPKPKDEENGKPLILPPLVEDKSMDNNPDLRLCPEEASTPVEKKDEMSTSVDLPHDSFRESEPPTSVVTEQRPRAASVSTLDSALTDENSYASSPTTPTSLSVSNGKHHEPPPAEKAVIPQGLPRGSSPTNSNQNSFENYKNKTSKTGKNPNNRNTSSRKNSNNNPNTHTNQVHQRRGKRNPGPSVASHASSTSAAHNNKVGNNFQRRANSPCPPSPSRRWDALKPSAVNNSPRYQQHVRGVGSQQKNNQHPHPNHMNKNMKSPRTTRRARDAKPARANHLRQPPRAETPPLPSAMPPVSYNSPSQMSPKPNLKPALQNSLPIGNSSPSFFSSGWDNQLSSTTAASTPVGGTRMYQRRGVVSSFSNLCDDQYSTRGAMARPPPGLNIPPIAEANRPDVFSTLLANRLPSNDNTSWAVNQNGYYSPSSTKVLRPPPGLGGIATNSPLPLPSFQPAVGPSTPQSNAFLSSCYDGLALPHGTSVTNSPYRPANQRGYVKENPFADDDAEIEAELQELGGQMVGSILDF